MSWGGRCSWGSCSRRQTHNPWPTAQVANRSVLDPLLRDSREALVNKLQGLADSLCQAQSPFAHVEDPVPGILSGLTQGRFTASQFTLTDGRNLLGVLKAVEASPTLQPSATLACWPPPAAPSCGTAPT